VRRLLPVLASAVALTAPAQALAHAQLVRSEPADGTVLTEPPASVRLVFNDSVQPVEVEAIRNGGGSVLAGKERRAGSRAIVVPLRPDLADGDYTVRWRAVSDDGHVLQGVLAFGVGEGRAPPVAALTVEGGGLGGVELLSRWLFLAGLLLAAGAGVFELAVARSSSRRTSGLAAVGFVLAAVGSFGLVPHEGLDPTRAERAYELGAVLAMTGVAAAAISLVEPWTRFLAWACALALLPVPTLAGHALDRGHSRALAVVADVLHLASAAVWVGGIVALFLTLPHAADRAALARRFSTVALVSVCVLAVTGVTRALGELSAVSQLWSTGYGRAVAIKTALLAVLVVLGYVNRARLMPRRAFDSLRRTLAAEATILAAVVIAAAFLTALPPGRALARKVAAPAGPPPAPPRGALVLAQEADRYGVAIAAVPARASTPVQVTVLGPDNNGVEADPVVVNGKEATTRCGPGCYAVTLPPHPRTIDVTVQGAPPVRFELPKRWPPPPGSALAEGAMQAYLALRSVVIDEQLSSNPELTLHTRFTFEAPNRFTYRIRGGPAAVVIGARRWDQAKPGARWVETDASPSKQPTPAWRRATSARLLAPNRVAFYDPTIPAWFDVTVDPLTARPVRLHMTAAAHFMRHRYSAFDHAPPITAPISR
jgi:copper transport protein